MDTETLDFIDHICDALQTAVESASDVTLEGRERQFRHALAKYLFEKVLGWEGHCKVGEIYDIACFDDENFPIIITETKWGVDLTSDFKEKLRRRVEELGSVKYCVLANERELNVYSYDKFKLKDVAMVNIAVAIGYTKKQFELSDKEKNHLRQIELLKRERLVRVEESEYFEKTHRETAVSGEKGIKLLTDNLKTIVVGLTFVFQDFFQFYKERKDHYSGKFLQNTFNDWLKISMKEEEYRKSLDENDKAGKEKIVEVFCRETAYVLLGRVLFTRICEDKDIIESMVSGKAIANSLQYYEKRKIENVYLRLFNESREEIRKYYGHLHELGFFDWWLVEEVKRETLQYDDRTIQDRLEGDLNENIRKTLRRLNRFNFLEVNRDILGDVYQGFLPPEERKRLGEFYTPKEVIEYILDAVGYRSENEVRSKRILDPACGSGGFLVEAMRRLIEKYRRIGFNLKDPDNARQVIQECVNSTFGLDIHPFACFITEMNLLFQLVDLYDAVRLKDKYYELPRLNIYRTDSLTSSGDAIIDLMDYMDNSRRVVLIGETKGADKLKNMTFDFVVGNPPYIRVHHMQAEYKDYLKKTYLSPQGDFDVYVCFIERGIKWLNEEGKLGYITSNKYLLREYGKYLRAFILNNCRLISIIDISYSDVFKEASIYPAITILRRGTKPFIESTVVQNTWEGELTICLVQATSLSVLRDVLEKIENQEHGAFDDFEIFTKNQQRFKGNPGFVFDIFAGPTSEKILAKIESNGKPLGRFSKISCATPRSKDYYAWGKELSEMIPEDSKDYVRFVVCRNISPYSIRYGMRINTMKKSFHHPYLKFNPDLFSKEKWGSFKEKKVIVRGNDTRLTAVFDNEGYGGIGIYFIRQPENVLNYTTAILNSDLINFYYLKKYAPLHIGGKYISINGVHLERIPIRLPKSDREKKLFEELSQEADGAHQISRQKWLTEEKIKSFPKSYLKDNMSFDELVNVVIAQNISKPSYNISDSTLRSQYMRDPYGKEVFRILLGTNEYLDFRSEELATYVFRTLEKATRVTKRELLEMKIPHSDLKRILQEYEADKALVIQNEREIKQLEKRINNLVYELYDTPLGERRTIEKYLAEL